MENFKNFTPHQINFCTPDGVQEIPSSGVARVSETLGEVCPGFYTRSFGAVEGLPEREEGVLVITSAMVAEVAWADGRSDVVCPTKFVRDDAGRITGCAGFVVSGMFKYTR